MESNNIYDVLNQVNYNIQINQQNINANNIELERLSLKDDVKSLFQRVLRRMELVWNNMKNEFANNEENLDLTPVKRALVRMFEERTQNLRNEVSDLFWDGLRKIRKLIEENKFVQANNLLQEKRNLYGRLLNEFNNIAAENNEEGHLEMNFRLILQNVSEDDLVYNAGELQQFMQNFNNEQAITQIDINALLDDQGLIAKNQCDARLK